MDIMAQVNMLSKSRMKKVEGAFVQACLKEGITDPTAMVLVATTTLRNINRDVVAGHKASNSRKQNIRRNKLGKRK